MYIFNIKINQINLFNFRYYNLINFDIYIFIYYYLIKIFDQFKFRYYKLKVNTNF